MIDDQSEIPSSTMACGCSVPSYTLWTVNISCQWALTWSTSSLWRLEIFGKLCQLSKVNRLTPIQKARSSALLTSLSDHQVSFCISGNWWLLQCSCLPALSRRGQGDSALRDINKDKRGHGYQTEFSKALPWFPGLQDCMYRHTYPPMQELLLPSDYCHCNVYSAAPLYVPRGQGPCRGLLFMNSCLPASIHSPYKHLLSAAFAGLATVQRTQDIATSLSLAAWPSLAVSRHPSLAMDPHTRHRLQHLQQPEGHKATSGTFFHYHLHFLYIFM